MLYIQVVLFVFGIAYSTLGFLGEPDHPERNIQKVEKELYEWSG